MSLLIITLCIPLYSVCVEQCFFSPPFCRIASLSIMSVGHGLDVLLLCYDEELQPWQKAVFEKHKQAEKKHEEDLKNYKQEMRQFYAGLGVTYNKKNGTLFCDG